MRGDVTFKTLHQMSLVVRKPVFGVSDQVRHKPGCTATEDGYKLEISDLESRGIYLCSENKGADQLRGYREADLRLCFRICKNPDFSRRGSNKSTHTPSIKGNGSGFFFEILEACIC